MLVDNKCPVAKKDRIVLIRNIVANKAARQHLAAVRTACKIDRMRREANNG